MALRKLGRGLDGLIQANQDLDPAEAPPAPVPGATALPLDLLDPNPFQPRQGMDLGELERLKDSIRAHGVLQPIVVRPHGERYQIVAGERRFRACQGLELDEVPVVVRDVPDEEMLELALIENLQREDLDPIEKAESFKAYLDRSGQTQESAAGRLGLDRSTISNMIRLLDLPPEVKHMVRGGQVAMGHARAILSVPDPARQIALAERVVRDGLSVRQVERLATGDGPRRGRSRSQAKSPFARDLERRLRESLGTKVSVEEGRKAGSGKLVIEFYTPDDLERLLSIFG